MKIVLVYALELYGRFMRYGRWYTRDGIGNAVEDNSGIFCLVQMH